MFCTGVVLRTLRYLIFGRPVLLHDKDSRGALAYLALAGEMIRREEEHAGIGSSAPAAEVVAP